MEQVLLCVVCSITGLRIFALLLVDRGAIYKDSGNDQQGE